MYYPSILLCIVLLYFLGGKQRKVRVGNDPLRHLSFDLYGLKSKILYSSLGTNWLAKTETCSQGARKTKNNPDEVHPTSQTEPNSVKWLKEVEYKKQEQEVPAINLGGVSRWDIKKRLLGTRPGNSNLATELFKKTCYSFIMQFLY